MARATRYSKIALAVKVIRTHNVITPYILLAVFSLRRVQLRPEFTRTNSRVWESSIYGRTVYDELASQNYSRGIKLAIAIHDKFLTTQERFITRLRL